MIDLQWLTRGIGISGPVNERVLQYRFMYYAGQPEAYWSDWKDVPEVDKGSMDGGGG